MSAPMPASELYVGLMSGTSLDGVDALVADFSTAQPRSIASAYLPYPAELRDALLALNDAGHDELRRASELSVRLARLYAEATQMALTRADLPRERIRAIGCHGQTVRHRPQDGYSLQLNQPALLAELSGITVVADFRSRDIAAGGQGAPLVPAFHDRALRHETRHRVIANIGGIANLTDLAPGKPARGFDTGPGNMLLDAWATRQLGTRYDAGGGFAAQGQVLPTLLDALRRHPYFALPAPKSCGREEFHLGWLLPYLAGNESAADVQATLLELTARSLVDALAKECGGADELLVCGGGVHNDVLMQRLQTLLPGSHVTTTDAFGVSADFLEALAFAWLARQCMHNETGNLPEATGARGPRVLGAIYPNSGHN